MTCSRQYPLRTSLPADCTEVLPSPAFVPLQTGVCLSLLLATLLWITLQFCQLLVSVVSQQLIAFLTDWSLLREEKVGAGTSEKRGGSGGMQAVEDNLC